MTSVTPQQVAEVLHEAADAIAADTRYSAASRLVCASILDARAEAALHTARNDDTKEHRA